jgi:ribosomal subunit interface protein
MKVTYTGRQIELSPAQTRQLETEFQKVGKLLDNGRGEAEARVVLSHERHLNNVEVTVPWYDHELVGQASDTDLFTAVHAAAGKLHSQAIRLKEKWRDTKRVAKPEAAAD